MDTDPLNTENLPKVYVDARMVSETAHGIARYVVSLAKGLYQLSVKNPLPYEPVFIVSSPEIGKKYFSEHAYVECPFSHLSIGETLGMGRWLNAQRPDVVHATGFASFPGLKKKYVQTVHDLNHRHYGNLMQKIYYGAVLNGFASYASHLFSVSEFSRHEVRSWLGAEAPAIELSWNALDSIWFDSVPPSLAQSVLSKWNLKPRGYLLNVHNRKPHRNLEALFQGYARSGATLPLVLPGKRELTDPPGVSGLGAMSEMEFVALVQNARALISASEYEGFGLPPVEAVASGTPVIVSDIPPHREGLHGLSGPFIEWVAPRGSWEDSIAQFVRKPFPEVPAHAIAALRDRFSSVNLGMSVDRVYRRMLKLGT